MYYKKNFPAINVILLSGYNVLYLKSADKPKTETNIYQDRNQRQNKAQKFNTEFTPCIALKTFGLVFNKNIFY